GVAAGMSALEGAAPDGESAPLVLVLACDVPAAASAVPGLLRGATDHDAREGGGEGGGDGACLVDRDGRRQWLTAVYRTASLRHALTAVPARGAPVRALVAGLDLVAIPARGSEAADVDTWADLAALEST